MCTSWGMKIANRPAGSSMIWPSPASTCRSFFRIVRLDDLHSLDRRPADRFDTGLDELHVGEFAMRFPEALFARLGRVFLDHREDGIAVDQVLALLEVRKIASLQKLERRCDAWRELHIACGVLDGVGDHVESLIYPQP